MLGFAAEAQREPNAEVSRFELHCELIFVLEILFFDGKLNSKLFASVPCLWCFILTDNLHTSYAVEAGIVLATSICVFASLSLSVCIYVCLFIQLLIRNWRNFVQNVNMWYYTRSHKVCCVASRYFSRRDVALKNTEIALKIKGQGQMSPLSHSRFTIPGPFCNTRFYVAIIWLCNRIASKAPW